MSEAVVARSSLRREFGRALELGELLLLVAVVVLAPLIRMENAYVPATSLPTHDVAGEAFFLWMVGLLALLSAARVAAAGRLVLPEPWTVALLGAWTLFLAIRASAADHPYEAHNMVRAWLSHLLLFAAVLMALGDRRGLRQAILAAVAASLVAESLRAIWQTYVELPALRQGLIDGSVMLNPEMRGPIARSRLMSTEPFNSFVTSNSLGIWLAMAGLAAAGAFGGMMAVLAGRGTRRWMALASWLPVVAVFLVAFRLTGSKGAWLALLGGLVGAVTLAAPVSDARLVRRLRMVGLACMLLAVAVAFAYWLVPSLPGRAGLAASVEVRGGYWRAAAAMAGDHPMLGVGPGSYGTHFSAYKGPMDEESGSVHCAWLETAAESGLIGLALFAAFWGLLFWRMLRRPQQIAEKAEEVPGAEHFMLALLIGAGAVMVFGWLKFGQDDLGFVREIWSGGEPFANKLAAVLAAKAVHLPILWGMAFVLIAWPLRSIGALDDNQTAGRWMTWALAAAVGAFLLHASVDMDMGLRSIVGMALILAALGLSGPGCRAIRWDGGRSAAGAAGLLLVAVLAVWLGVRDFRRAGLLDALSVPPPDEMEKPFDRIMWRIGRLEAASAADPENYHLKTRLAIDYGVARQTAPDTGRAETFRSKTESTLREAVALAPNRAAPHRMLGQWLLLEGRYREAASVFEELHAIYPLKAVTFLEWGDAELLAGDAETARALYRRALDTSRRVNDEAIHLSIVFENPEMLSWEEPKLAALAAELEKAAARFPDDGVLLFRQGVVALARSDAKTMLDRLDRAAAAEPRDAQLLLFAGYGLRLAGEPEKALEKMREAGKLEGSAGAAAAGPRAVRTGIDRTSDMIRVIEQRRRAGQQPAARMEGAPK